MGSTSKLNFSANKTQLTQQESILFFLDIPTANLDIDGSTAACSQAVEASEFDINSYKGIKEVRHFLLSSVPQSVTEIQLGVLNCFN